MIAVLAAVQGKERPCSGRAEQADRVAVRVRRLRTRRADFCRLCSSVAMPDFKPFAKKPTHLLGDALPELHLVQQAAARERADVRKRKLFFIALCVLEMAANYDAGLLPAVLTDLQNEIGLSLTQLGSLGAMVYVGLCVGCGIGGTLLSKMMSQRKVRLVLLVAVVVAVVLVTLVVLVVLALLLAMLLLLQLLVLQLTPSLHPLLFSGADRGGAAELALRAGLLTGRLFWHAALLIPAVNSLSKSLLLILL